MRKKLGVILILFAGYSTANEGLLLDSRLETSDLDWEKSPQASWDEISGHDGAGNEYRMFQTCAISKTEKTEENWLRTNYIRTDGANRVFVEIEFTIRDCEDLVDVKVCKETFNLHYYESDSESDVPQWNINSFLKVDTVAADRRFLPDENSNRELKPSFEIREIGPLTKNGIYIGIQDSGACMALMHVKVYYKFCPTETQNLAIFPRTISGPSEVSLAKAQGACVPNATQVKDSPPLLYCNAKGDWSVNSGKCLCTSGYMPNKDFTSCQPCGKETYKSGDGNNPCKQCPPYSSAQYSAGSKCSCDAGYYRATGDQDEDACTAPPSAPRDLTKDINESKVTLSWMNPAQPGGREDIFYEVECKRCSSLAEIDCQKCGSDIEISPNWRTSRQTVEVGNLDPGQVYVFKVMAKNGVSSMANSEPEYKEIRVSQTNFKPPTGIANVNLEDITSNSVRMSWGAPPRPNGQIIDYETVLLGLDSNFEIRNLTTSRDIRIGSLAADTTYKFKVRARTRAGYGPFSNSIELNTTPASEYGQDGVKIANPNTDEFTTGFYGEQSNDKTAQIAGAAAGGAVIVIMLIVFLVICTKRNSYRKGRKYATELGVTDVTFHPIHNMSTNQPAGKMFVEPWMTEPSIGGQIDQTELDLNQIDIGGTLRRNGADAVDIYRGTFRPFNGNAPVDVMVKKLNNGFSPQQKGDFLNDKTLMSRFYHENIIRFEGAVVNSRPMMVVTEYMEHPFADDFLRMHRREFSQGQLVAMMRQVAVGMKYLVDQGFVHRDLSAQNIACNAQLHCKIADFSLARKITESQFAPPGGIGNYKWAAPEVISQRRFSEASDVWSFGVLGWEFMNYGESPYWEMNDEEVIRKIESGYRLPCTQGCPQVIHQLMLDCWKSSPNERPPFNVIIKRLDSYLRNPAAAAPSSHRSSQYSGSCLTMDSQTSNTSSLGQWLDGIGLGHYRERLQQNGFNTLETIIQMSRRDMNELGIVSSGDQEHLQQQASVLYQNKRAVPFTSRCEMSLERGTTVAV